MKKIRLNIATHRRISRIVFVPTILFLLGSGLVLIILSTQLISQYFQDSKNLTLHLKNSKTELNRLEKLGQDAATKISTQKNSWTPRITFCNFLITKKTSLLTDRLSFLEQTLPPEIQVESLQWENPQSEMHITLISPGFPSVLSTYRTLSPYGLDVVTDYEKDGRFYLGIKLKYDHP